MSEKQIAADFGKSLCQALGVDAQWVTELHLVIKAAEPPKLVVHRLVNTQDAASVAAVVETYGLRLDAPAHVSDPVASALPHRQNRIRAFGG